MKKNIVFFLVIVVLFSLVSCGKKEEESSFIGKVAEVSETHVIVTPNMSESIRNAGDAVRVDLKYSKEVLAVGDSIRVTYVGAIMESYPLQVNVVKIEKIN